MPWEEVTKVSLREEFIKLATQPGANRRQLCRRFKVSPKTAYKWLRRYAAGGRSALHDRSRRPHKSPRRCTAAVEQAVVDWRVVTGHCWGARKIARLLRNGATEQTPAPSTVNNILRRRGLLQPRPVAAAQAWQRFEREGPNQLWQMDFKGDFPVGPRPCVALTVLDDHSRFNLALQACRDQRHATVQRILRQTFERYGLPAEMLMDHGAPWGKAGELTQLAIWLIRLGIRITHGRVRHPQTQGKDERFHRTLKLEVLRGRHFATLAQCQNQFDRFRDRYNLLRPHQALGLEVPASRYQPSPVPYPAQLPPIQYPDDMLVRRVQAQGWLTLHGRYFRVSKALRGYPVGLRVCDASQRRYQLYFCHQPLAPIDLDQA